MWTRGFFVLLFLIGSSGFMLNFPAMAKPGDLDTTFNSPLGWVFYDDAMSAHGVATQPDGKIVAVGTRWNTVNINDDVLVVRYDSEGSTDTSFGTNGVITFDGEAGYIDKGSAVAVEPDGKIVAVANSHNGPDSFNVVLLRYEPDGSPDSTFGTSGTVTYMGSPKGATDLGNALLIQPDGKIVVVGSTEDGTQADLLVLRYNADGTPDNTFGLNGAVTYNYQTNGLTQSNDYGRAVTLQPDGRIIVVGNTNINSGKDDVLIVRFNANGFLDTSFGGGRGAVAFDSAGRAEFGNAVAVYPDSDRIVIVGTMDDKYVLVLRYEANGALDGGFGDSGIVTYSNMSHNSGNAVAIQDDGKILVAGSTTMAAPDLLVLRYEENGTLDAGFGNGGIVIFDSELYYSDEVASMAVQADGKIVLAGTRENNMNGDTDMLIVRLVGREFLPPPSSQVVFSYPPTWTAEIDTDPGMAKPLGVGPVAAFGGNTLSLHVALAPFSGPVDVYFLVFSTALDEHEMYVLHSDDSLRVLSDGLAPWRSNQLGSLGESLFGDILVEMLPKGLYNLYVGVTPPGTVDSFYLWTTYLVIP